MTAYGPLMHMRLTAGRAREYRRGCGNRVYAAQAALPAQFHRPAAQTDAAGLIRDALDVHTPELRWVRDGITGWYYPSTHTISLGTRAPLFIAAHEAAHALVLGTGHDQTFVDAYLAICRVYYPQIVGPLVARLRWQGFEAER